MAAPRPIKLTSIATNPAAPKLPEPFVVVIPGYDPTKTQTLKHVNGVFTWVTDA